MEKPKLPEGLFIMQTGQFLLRQVEENTRPIRICQLFFYLAYTSPHASLKKRHMNQIKSTDIREEMCTLMALELLYCTTSSDK